MDKHDSLTPQVSGLGWVQGVLINEEFFKGSIKSYVYFIQFGSFENSNGYFSEEACTL